MKTIENYMIVKKIASKTYYDIFKAVTLDT